jgi:myo-inositol-1(or 4)-monophosphatase
MLPTLENIINLARHAGGLLREGYGKTHAVDHKGRIDLVTEMDGIVEDYLLGEIHTLFPDHTVDSEESGVRAGADSVRWFIDPLDGTTNYAHAIPFFSVSIGVAENGQVKLGVVYDPMRDEFFSAERGKGAWLNGSPIHVSATHEMINSLLVTGFPYDIRINNLDNFAHFTRMSQGVRRLGSAALDMCYVASGRFEGYWEKTLQAWDMAAASLIVQEAGGRVTDLEGSEDIFRPPFAILAANPYIHEQMLREFANL